MFDGEREQVAVRLRTDAGDTLGVRQQTYLCQWVIREGENKHNNNILTRYSIKTFVLYFNLFTCFWGGWGWRWVEGNDGSLTFWVRT